MSWQLQKKWHELKNNYTICGFDRKVPKFCCPPDDQKRTPKHSNINGYNDLILEETSELMNNVFTGVIELEKKLLEKNKKDNVAPPILSDIVPEIASNIIPEAVSEVAPKMSADIIWIHRTTTKSTTTATEATKTTTESTTTTTKPTITTTESTTTMSVEGISEEAIETSIDAKDVEEDIRPNAIPEHLTNIVPEVLSTEQEMVSIETTSFPLVSSDEIEDTEVEVGTGNLETSIDYKNVEEQITTPEPEAVTEIVSSTFEVEYIDEETEKETEDTEMETILPNEEIVTTMKPSVDRVNDLVTSTLKSVLDTNKENVQIPSEIIEEQFPDVFGESDMVDTMAPEIDSEATKITIAPDSVADLQSNGMRKKMPKFHGENESEMTKMVPEILSSNEIEDIKEEITTVFPETEMEEEATTTVKPAIEKDVPEVPDNLVHDLFGTDIMNSPDEIEDVEEEMKTESPETGMETTLPDEKVITTMNPTVDVVVNPMISTLKPILDTDEEIIQITPEIIEEDITTQISEILYEHQFSEAEIVKLEDELLILEEVSEKTLEIVQTTDQPLAKEDSVQEEIEEEMKTEIPETDENVITTIKPTADKVVDLITSTLKSALDTDEKIIQLPVENIEENIAVKISKLDSEDKTTTMGPEEVPKLPSFDNRVSEITSEMVHDYVGSFDEIEEEMAILIPENKMEEEVQTTMKPNSENVDDLIISTGPSAVETDKEIVEEEITTLMPETKMEEEVRTTMKPNVENVDDLIISTQASVFETELKEIVEEKVTTQISELLDEPVVVATMPPEIKTEVTGSDIQNEITTETPNTEKETMLPEEKEITTLKPVIDKVVNLITSTLKPILDIDKEIVHITPEIIEDDITRQVSEILYEQEVYSETEIVKLEDELFMLEEVSEKTLEIVQTTHKPLIKEDSVQEEIKDIKEEITTVFSESEMEEEVVTTQNSYIDNVDDLITSTQPSAIETDKEIVEEITTQILELLDEPVLVTTMPPEINHIVTELAPELEPTENSKKIPNSNEEKIMTTVTETINMTYVPKIFTVFQAVPEVTSESLPTDNGNNVESIMTSVTDDFRIQKVAETTPKPVAEPQTVPEITSEIVSGLALSDKIEDIQTEIITENPNTKMETMLPEVKEITTLKPAVDKVVNFITSTLKPVLNTDKEIIQITPEIIEEDITTQIPEILYEPEVPSETEIVKLEDELFMVEKVSEKTLEIELTTNQPLITEDSVQETTFKSEPINKDSTVEEITTTNIEPIIEISSTTSKVTETNKKILVEPDDDISEEDEDEEKVLEVLYIDDESIHTLQCCSNGQIP